MKFYRCDHCGNIVTFVHSAGVPVMCCGQKMTELVPGTSDGALEKHVPVVSVEGNLVKVQVGSVEHPMLAEHYIQFIAIETKQVRTGETSEECHQTQPFQLPGGVFKNMLM